MQMASLPALGFAIDIVLAGYVIWEVVRFGPQYRQLKLDLANGEMQARARVYRKAIGFEWAALYWRCWRWALTGAN